MKRIWLAGILAVVLPGVACAQGPIPDPLAPNNYVVTPAPGGGSNALGYDSRQWSYWPYNRRTNSYRYFGTEPRWQARCYASVADFC
jgi:hypothetical protein